MLKILKYAIDLIYRERDICFVCGEKLSGIKAHICGECRSKLAFVDHRRCRVCGVALEYADESKLHLCRDCEVHPKHFTKGVSPLKYEGHIKKLIYDYKYHDSLHYKKLFGELLIEEIVNSDMEKVDLILGVPLSLKRENSRGYNQARLISDYIGKRLGIKSGEGLLARTKHTSVQNVLGKAQRMKNLEGAFSVAKPCEIRGKNILLIDDIYTTGATLDECAKTLLENGATNVNIATVATAVDRKNKEE